MVRDGLSGGVTSDGGRSSKGGTSTAASGDGVPSGTVPVSVTWTAGGPSEVVTVTVGSTGGCWSGASVAAAQPDWKIRSRTRKLVSTGSRRFIISHPFYGSARQDSGGIYPSLRYGAYAWKKERQSMVMESNLQGSTSSADLPGANPLYHTQQQRTTTKCACILYILYRIFHPDSITSRNLCWVEAEATHP